MTSFWSPIGSASSRARSRSICLKRLSCVLRVARAWALALALCSVSASVPACVANQAAPPLASGERVVTGQARYDQFFGEVNDLFLTVRDARREQARVHAALARRAGLPGEALSDALGARLRERTAKLAAEGLTLQLEFAGIDLEARAAAAAAAAQDGTALDDDASATGESAADAPADGAPGAPLAAILAPSATLRTPGRVPEARELRLLEVVAQAAVSSATNYVAMSRSVQSADALRQQLEGLRADVDTAFADLDARERVAAKLEEAERFLPALAADAERVAGDADTLIAVLDEAANTAPPRRRAREAGPRNAAQRDGSGAPRSVPTRAHASSPALSGQ